MKSITKYFILLSVVFFLKNAVFCQTSYNKELKQVAISLYDSFDQVQKRSGGLSFSDSARTEWNNLPVGMRMRVGTSIGNMSDDQRKLLHRILSVSMSSQGYLKATSIMHLDDLLNRYYDSLFYKKDIDTQTFDFIKSLQWSHKNFYFAFFGDPNESTWGYKLEGHHLSINFTFTDDKLSVTPFFLGTDPAEYQTSEYAGWRVLGQEEDLGIKLIQLMSPSQQTQAIKSGNVPRDIITAAESGIRLIEEWGIKASAMTQEQQAILQYIIREFVYNLDYEKANSEYEKIIKAGIDKVYFGWIGEIDEYKPHYYVLNGPTFLIEFDNNGGPRNSANHIHAIWREKGNEYGEDVLKNHYKTEKHK